MTERKKKILKVIINEYVTTAEPIGSRTLARKYDFGVSSATIRNEMADLEEAGYLKQPHRSAGRVPSDKGYRFYVDTLMNSKRVSKQKMKLIEEKYSSRKDGIQELIQHTSQMLSDLTEYTSLVLSPQIKKSIFRHLQLVPIASKKILMVLVTDTGLIRNKVIDTPVAIVSEELDNISRFLNERLYGLSLHQINDQLLDEINKQLISRFDLAEKLKLLKKEIFENNFSTSGKIYLGGTAYILDQPEFSDVKKLRTVLEILEQKKLLRDVLANYEGSSELKILIGSENSFEEIKDCSMVIATYHLNDRPIGKIGVLGPTRMEYSKVVGSVKYVAEILSNILTNQ
ncbi:heat-inducible transcriptional repressor HrcA [Natroniella sp. ANB-PHB2]|uniref:heat-inducible transcriptional repressor HrcA n=1 Tax=Natroniella sp. ANB-PHB2 TaxID=3384444 RepID=UPI0038D3D51A